MPGQKFGPAWFPGLIAVGLAVCGALLIAVGLRQPAPWIAAPEWIRSPRARAGIAALIGGLVLYMLAADALGFHLTGALLLTLWPRGVGASSRVTGPAATIAPLAIHLSFYQPLRPPPPRGALER